MEWKYFKRETLRHTRLLRHMRYFILMFHSCVEVCDGNSESCRVDWKRIRLKPHHNKQQLVSSNKFPLLTFCFLHQQKKAIQFTFSCWNNETKNGAFPLH